MLALSHHASTPTYALSNSAPTTNSTSTICSVSAGPTVYLESVPSSAASAETPLLPTWYHLRQSADPGLSVSRKWHTASLEAGIHASAARQVHFAAILNWWAS
jgi:hypothetical protein